MWMQVEGEHHKPSNQSSSQDAGFRVLDFIRSFPTLKERNISHPFMLSLFERPLASALFDWGDDKTPNIPYTETVVYEGHVRALSPGHTFADAVNIVPYLKWLGVTALELMPIFEFCESERGGIDAPFKLIKKTNRVEERKGNYWGYMPSHFFHPMNRYSSDSSGGAVELKMLVKALHAEGIECIIDVVYNHTAHASCPIHFLDVYPFYFMGRRTPKGFKHMNISGCGNTLSPNSPMMLQLIMESLRWWVQEYHIDGFRLDAAAIFCRDSTGKPLSKPAIMDAIASDEVLRDTKIFTESWDSGDKVGMPLFLLGSKFPRAERITEFNALYRDSVRRFFRGDNNSTDAFQKALRGTPNIFEMRAKAPFSNLPRGVCHSLNFVACHDGFTLADVVSYERRVQTDGYPEVSFNCGIEGQTNDEHINKVRAKQMRNHIFTLAVSRGVPLLLQGDELGATKMGNSNPWNEPRLYAARLGVNPRDCSDAEGLVEFTRYMLDMRRSRTELRGTDFFEDLEWVDIDGETVGENEGEDEQSIDQEEKENKESEDEQSKDEKEDETETGEKGIESEKSIEREKSIESEEDEESKDEACGFVGCLIKKQDGTEWIFLAFNQSKEEVSVALPSVDSTEVNWKLEVDTCSKNWRRDEMLAEETKSIRMTGQSCILCIGTKNQM